MVVSEDDAAFATTFTPKQDTAECAVLEEEINMDILAANAIQACNTLLFMKVISQGHVVHDAEFRVNVHLFSPRSATMYWDFKPLRNHGPVR